MGILKREESRAAFRRPADSVEDSVIGKKMTNNILRIDKADTAERTWGRTKWAARIGYISLLAAKGLQHVTESISNRSDILEDGDFTRFDGRWFWPTTVALYGISRFGLYMQNGNHEEAATSRKKFAEMANSADIPADMVNGAINQLNNLHHAHIIGGLLDLSVPGQEPTPAKTFLERTDPATPAPRVQN